MKSETIAYGMEILTILDDNEDISFSNLENISSVKGKELKELLKYLKNKNYIKWISSLFINEHHIADDKIKLNHNGMEVNLGKRDYFEESKIVSQEINNQTNVTNSSEFQVAQNTGDNSLITQNQDNSQTIILNKIIEDDIELDPEKKSELKEVVDNINKLKQAGETTEKLYEWVKKGIGICARYGPYLLSLLPQ